MEMVTEHHANTGARTPNLSIKSPECKPLSHQWPHTHIELQKWELYSCVASCLHLSMSSSHLCHVLAVTWILLPSIWLTLLLWFIWDYIMPSNLVCIHVVIVLLVATPPGSMDKFVIRKATSQELKEPLLILRTHLIQTQSCNDPKSL